MRGFQKLKAAARHRLGTAFHNAGGATRSDLLQLREQSDLELRAQAGQLEELSGRVEALEQVQAELRRQLDDHDRLLEIEAVSRWIRQATLAGSPLISVVMPTCDRPELLERAIGSVLAQRYSNWELVVVDDGKTPSEPVMQSIRDPRVSWHRSHGHGADAARNLALAEARGELIAYLDDDNMMDPDWLYAVAWAFEQRPEVEVLYGAIVIDDIARLWGRPGRALPRIVLHAFDRESLRKANLADMSAIAHRAGLAEAHFDESLEQLGDWDLLLRLTAEHDPLVLPTISCYYTTDAPDRLTSGPTHGQDRGTVLAKARGIGPK